MAIIGIDLGTFNSAAAVLRGSRPVLIPSAEGVSSGGNGVIEVKAMAIDRSSTPRHSRRRCRLASRRAWHCAFLAVAWCLP